MDVIRFGLGLRALRRRRRWTQDDLGARAGVSRAAIWRIERGRADRIPVHVLVRVAVALDARIDVRLLWQGEGLDRLLDAGHADLVERTLELLSSSDWITATEVSFNVRGERGSIDILAFHAASGSLLVIEVKSVVPDMQAMLSGIDRKGRLAREIARDRGWKVTTVTRLLVLPDERTARRRVELHAVTFRTALPARTMEIRRWIRHPDGTMDGVLFVSDAHQASARHRVTARRDDSGAPRTPHMRLGPADPAESSPYDANVRIRLTCAQVVSI
jgi:transcriptional regulator with XRE-family HTH domain